MDADVEKLGKKVDIVNGILIKHGSLIECIYILVTDIEAKIGEVARKIDQVIEQLRSLDGKVNLIIFLLDIDQYTELVEHSLDQILRSTETIADNIRKAAL